MFTDFSNKPVFTRDQIDKLQVSILDSAKKFNQQIVSILREAKRAQKISKKCPWPFDIQCGVESSMPMKVDSFISSSRETVFGETVLEPLIVKITQIRFGNGEFGPDPFDISFLDDLVWRMQCKTSPNWGNKDQWSALIDSIEACPSHDNEGRVISPILLVAYSPTKKGGIDTVVKKRGKRIVQKPFRRLEGIYSWKFLTGDFNFMDTVARPMFQHASLDTSRREIEEVIKKLKEN